MAERHAVRNASIVLASFIIFLILAEVTLRVFDLYPVPPHPLCPSRPDLYQADDKIGYRLWRSTETTDRYPVDSPEALRLLVPPS